MLSVLHKENPDMFKYLRIVVLLAVVVALLPAASSNAQDKVTIRITTWAGVDESAEFQQIIDRVNASQDAFEVLHEPKPSDYYTVLQTSLAGGEAADLMWLDQDHMPWAWEGVLLDISQYLANDTRDTANPDDYFPGVWQTVALGEGVYGLPWIAQPVVLYYNKDIFDAMGVAYPTPDWTWDEFRATAVSLTNEEHYGFTMNGWPPPYIWMWGNGGDYVSADLTQAPVDDPAVIEAVQFYADMIYNEECCPSQETIAEEGFGEMFKAGRVAMFMGGAADDLDRVEGLNVGVSAVPKGNVTGENTTFAWIASTVINAKTAHPDEAYEALVLLTEGIQNWKIVSPRVSQTTVEHLVASEPRKEANAADIIAAVPYMRGLTLFPGYLEFSSVIWSDFFTPAFNGEDTAAALAPDARILLEDVLASQ
jgi:multiple sugar transport system substrate-binding protein